MQLNLGSFNENKSTHDRVEDAIASGISMEGLDEIKDLQVLLQDIFCSYQLEKGVFRLIDEKCSYCGSKLKRKGVYTKDIVLPGGARFLLSFHQYSCSHCKKKIDRKLGSWFDKGSRYSSNIKSDAVRFYLSHLSSYDAVKDELNKLYKLNISKRTVRKWLKDLYPKATQILENERDFSGHFIYDEEYIKVFEGDVGKKDAKLHKIEIYLLLFRDAITKKPIIMLSDSLDKSILISHWRKFMKWTIKNKIPFKTLTTDGKREYNTMTKELNQEFKNKIEHSYCIFHFKKNLYEVCNKHIFGVMQTKKELPDHIINQIKELEHVIDLPTETKFKEQLEILDSQIQTFIKPLQDQIKRMKKYAKNYTLHKKYPFLRTTNLAEHWFGQTKPQKIKKGYKTKQGLLTIIRSLGVKITSVNWQQKLNMIQDISTATELLISGIIKKNKLLPA